MRNVTQKTSHTPSGQDVRNSATNAEYLQLSFVALLKHGVVMVDDKPCGRVEDIIVKPRHNQYAPVTGIVVQGANGMTFFPVEAIATMDSDGAELKSEQWGVRPFTLGDGEISLKSDILSQRVIDIARSALVRVYDVRLAREGEALAAIALDVHRSRWFTLGGHSTHHASDWRNFLPLSRHAKLPAHSSPNWVGRLKPAQIADLIEEANADEQDQLLAQVHTDPELEADVFEELEEDSQAEVFKSLSDEEAGEVLSRMRADDVADAVMELAQERRKPVLDLLPLPQRTKVLTLLGYNKATAGGLMGTEFIALPERTTVGEALERIRSATTHQPEALVTIHSLGSDGKLTGTVGVIQALQADPARSLREVSDQNVITASPEDDILLVVNRMADFNLLSLPVVDEEGLLLGVITVDDALEAAIPRDWANR